MSSMSLCFLLRRATIRMPVNGFASKTPTLIPSHHFAFSSAEEAAAERRRMKRRLRIEPPLQALRPNSPAPSRPPRDPRLPDTTSSLVGPRLSLHNRVQSLLRSGQLDAASATARHAVFSPPRPSVFTCNAVMAAMLRADRLNDVLNLFHYFFQQSNIVPNVVSYNILINTHCSAGRVDEALSIYHHILESAPFTPSHVTYRHLTRGLVDSNRISDAMDLLREMLNKGHGADTLVYDNLIDGFIKLGNMDKALEMFDELTERCVVYDGVVHATLMDAYFQKGMVREAMRSYKQLLDRKFSMNAVTCNTLLQVLLKYDRIKDARDLFDDMVVSHKPPHFTAINTDSYNLMVNRLFELDRVSDAIEVFKKMGPKPCVMDAACYNNIVGKLCSGDGWTEEAEKLLEEMPTRSVQPDKVTCELLVDMHLRKGGGDDALRVFDKTVEQMTHGVDISLYNKVIEDFVRKNHIDEAREVIKRMQRREVRPDVVSYDPIIVALCKSGGRERVLDVVEEMAKNGVVLSGTMQETVLRTFGEETCRGIERIFSERNACSVTDSSTSDPHSGFVAA